MPIENPDPPSNLNESADRHEPSPEAREELTELTATRVSLRRRIFNTIGYLGCIAAIGTLGTVVGGGYLARESYKVAEEAVPEAIASTAEREVEQRKAILMEAFLELEQEANDMLGTIVDFLFQLGNRLSTEEGAGALLYQLWTGMWDDGVEFWNEGDLEPDKIFDSGLAFVENDPVLSTKWKKIELAYQELVVTKDELIALEDELAKFNDEDLEEFKDDLREKLWERVRERFPLLNNLE